MIAAKMETSYSQNAEDKIALRHLSDIRDGSLLDIGAGDGKTFSNSLALIERGWAALLVEPSPSAFAALLDLHYKNPRVRLLHAAVGTEDRIVKFHEAGDSLYSTTRSDQAGIWSARGISYRSYWVPQVTVTTVMRELGGSAHLLSIDTEGTSFDILTQCPIGSWDTRVIILEHDSRAVEVSGWARERGYEVCSLNAENVVLQRPP